MVLDPSPPPLTICSLTTSLASALQCVHFVAIVLQYTRYNDLRDTVSCTTTLQHKTLQHKTLQHKTHAFQVQTYRHQNHTNHHTKHTNINAIQCNTLQYAATLFSALTATHTATHSNTRSQRTILDDGVSQLEVTHISLTHHTLYILSLSLSRYLARKGRLPVALMVHRISHTHTLTHTHTHTQVGH